MRLGIVLGLGSVVVKKVSQKYVTTQITKGEIIFKLDVDKLEKYLENPDNKLVNEIKEVYIEYGTNINKLWLDATTGFMCGKKLLQQNILRILMKEEIIDIEAIEK